MSTVEGLPITDWALLILPLSLSVHTHAPSMHETNLASSPVLFLFPIIITVIITTFSQISIQAYSYIYITIIYFIAAVHLCIWAEFCLLEGK